MSFKESIDLNRLPVHIAIIMDGNGRWAKRRGKLRIFGHQHGVDAVKEVTEACAELGVPYLTLYAFSTENWNRPPLEVNALMGLLVKTLHGELKTLQDNNIRLQAIGDLKSLARGCYPELMHAIRETASNDRMTLILALSYSARWELAMAARNIATQVALGNLRPEDINQERFASYLTTNNIPDPELLIRTSGEARISNFMLWQIAYTELYFTPVLWPDFTKEDLYKAIVDFQSRERRFGMTSEQIKVL
ncbi:MAG TPA: isoprenyl transferase [Bacteroidales bacterium]|nr:isoprenyl transferase [Bacteroidales bacterium]HSA42866.1 isoprenyl transferase [Bacteroidales bacterium]